MTLLTWRMKSPRRLIISSLCNDEDAKMMTNSVALPSIRKVHSLRQAETMYRLLDVTIIHFVLRALKERL
jgi:hypothetical protein